MTKEKLISLCVLILVVSVLIVICIVDKLGDTSKSSPNGNKISTNGVIISEIMTNNKKTYVDENGNSPEYINLYNTSNDTLSLDGYYISNEESNLEKCSLSGISIEPHGFFTLYSMPSAEKSTDKFYLNFQLSSSEEKIFLVSPNNKINIIRVPSLPSDVAYGIDLKNINKSNEYEYFSKGSIGDINSSEHSVTLTDIYQTPQYNISVSEYMTSNKSKVADNYRNTPNWIELHNINDEEVNLSGMMLSDTSSNPNKFVIPDGVTIQPNGYLVIWFDELNEYKDNNLHASFKLPQNDFELVLTDTNYNTILQTTISYIDKDISVGLDENLNVLYYNEPTPASENNTTSYSTIEEATSLMNKDVYISEVSAFPTDDTLEDYDWIEIYNNSSNDINLEGWKISKKFDTDNYYTFSDITIKSGEYLLLYASGNDLDDDDDDYNTYDYDDDDDSYPIYQTVYLPFKIGADGEKLYLFNNNNDCIDYFKTGWTSSGYTCGRSNNLDEVVYYDTPTPAYENSSTIYKGYSQMPELSNNGGYASIGENITANITDGTTIYYTDDGSEPTTNSEIFNNYTVNQNCVLRFLVCQDGYLPSTIYSSTYIVSETHDLPIISISTDYDGLYSNENGILAFGYNYENEDPYFGANFWQDWERTASFEYYTADGKKEINCLTDIKVFGQYSRAYPQKSLAVYFKGKYGTSKVEYPFFKDNEVTKFSSLILRAGGQDQNYAHIRDAFAEEVASEYSDLASMDWQPVAVYINGEYNGCYDLREKINKDYFKSHENIDEDNLTLLKDNEVVYGDRTSYNELIRYIRNHDLSVQEYYDYVSSKLNIENYIDYLITEIFFCNEDCGSNNKRYIDESNGKWRFVLYDVDMSLYSDSISLNGYNSLEKIFNPNGQGAIDMCITDIQRGLIQNDDYIQSFIKRYAELLNSNFMPENLIAKLDYMTNLMNNEMILNGQKWAEPTYDEWLENIDTLKNILEQRRDICKQQLINYFDLNNSEINELFPNG